MPRRLPWETSKPSAQSKKIPRSVPPAKRKRTERVESESESERKRNDVEETKTLVEVPTRREGRAASTSPPPEPPTERLMDEGLEKDDKYRMVEDEFLTIAQQFTVHLHAAEYKRQEKMVKSRNAHTIHSISRPVVGKMPDQTKRKVNGVELAKSQRKSLANLLGKVANDEKDSDSEDDDGLPYVGTTLHGLMDSPRRKAVSLGIMAPAARTTRSAAGFKKPAGQANSIGIYSPQPRKLADNPFAKTEDDGSTETSDDDYDLDAPVPAPQLIKSELQSSFYSSSSVSGPARSSQATSSKFTHPATKPVSFLSELGVKEEEKTQPTLSNTASSHERLDLVPRVSRFERARRLQEKKETEQTKKKTLDIIPSFL